MSSESRHRGAHPADRELFTAATQPVLQQAVADLSWLLSHGYARTSSLKLVGDRYALTERQRLAVGRAACSDSALAHRSSTRLSAAQMHGRVVAIDGFNLLLTLEASLGGGVLLHCRDGCLRDMSSVHGSYHAVAETDAAILLAAEHLSALKIRSVHWLLDSPVCNSGRLAHRLRELAENHSWPWTVETVFSPDAVLKETREAVVITSDPVILDHTADWYNMAAPLVRAAPESRASIMEMESNHAVGFTRLVGINGGLD